MSKESEIRTLLITLNRKVPSNCVVVDFRGVTELKLLMDVAELDYYVPLITKFGIPVVCIIKEDDALFCKMISPEEIYVYTPN